MSIASQVKSLTEDIEVSYGTRVAAVDDIVKDTRRTLGSFHREHQKMADDLRQSLAASSSARAGAVGELMTEIRGFIRGIEADSQERADEVKHMLTSFAKEHQDRTVRLKRELSSFQRNLSSAVTAMTAKFSADHRQARTHWQNLARVMAAKRGGKSIPAAKAEMGVSEAVKEEAQQAFETGELKDGVLKVIQAYPGGITLAEISRILAVAHIRISKPIKYLLAEMVVTKRDLEYFPT